MPFLFESKLLKNKSIFFSLLHICGIGKSNCALICKLLGFSINFKAKNLTDEQTNKLIFLIDYFRLNSINNKKIERFCSKSYKVQRKLQGLPIRGQRTRTNAKTSKKRLY